LAPITRAQTRHARVLLCLQAYHPAYSFGGTVFKGVALAKGLVARGHEVAVVTSSVVDRERMPPVRTRRRMVDGVEVSYLGTLARVGKVSVYPVVVAFGRRDMKRFDA